MYDHYIALDWAQINMAVARMTKESTKVISKDVPANIRELKMYLMNLKGKKMLTFEETTTSQWLYTELKDYADEILVCDPYRNHLLSEGAKTDKLDAMKLVKLLRSGMLKPVFHKSGGEFIRMRKFVSGYEDMVKAGVRLKNQRAAMFRAVGKCKRQKALEDRMDQFVLGGLDRSIAFHTAEKERYEAEMEKFSKKHKMIRDLDSLVGIGRVGAVKIAARVVEPKRFKNKGKWLSYCGLVKHDKMSGGRSYGKKPTRHCRSLKSVFKTAAISAIAKNANNIFKDHYEYLIAEKKYSEANARNTLARRIAVIALGILKSGQPFEAKRIIKQAA